MMKLLPPTLLAIFAAPILCVLALSTQAAASERDVLPSDYVSGAWHYYITKFVEPSGRVIDNVNGNVSHSESQGYGMLLSVAADDRVSFDRIWSWTQSNLLIRTDGLAAWRWDPQGDPHVKDLNNATDGDLLIAWALLRASRKWGDMSHQAAAARIVAAVNRSLVVDSSFGPVLLPGIEGFDGASGAAGPVVNLSYWVFPAIDELGVAFQDFPSRDLIASGIKLIEAAQFGPSKLPANWISVASDGQIEPAPGFELLFGYDAVRIPLYLGWYTKSPSALLVPFEDAWVSGKGTSIKVIDLESGNPVGAMTDPGYQAIVDLVQCSRGALPAVARKRGFDPIDYYPSTLQLLSVLAISERYPKCLISQS
ncbi:glycosyl hydrolase family 8 [Hoeflea ulvae]|uniref:Glucanase n=1 Tax=Hoeflea ulvae TaxID=2983764 RepID=A0ABT3YG82_9HYPH|nr:glycosyl hydrolase family 8 [Hoeflea ulvae]MCY0094910.1 glycosyl hydrolase family 8 [Hoeflea ulvae]